MPLEISSGEDNTGTVEHHAFSGDIRVDILLRPSLPLRHAPYSGAVLFPAAEEHENGILAALYIVNLLSDRCQRNTAQGLGALMYPGEDRQDIRSQQIKGVLLIYLSNPCGKIFLPDFHVIVENHDKIRRELLDGKPDAQIIPSGKAGIFAVKQHGHSGIPGILFKKLPPGAVGRGIIHDNRMVFALQGFNTIDTLSRTVYGAIMENNICCHRVSHPSFCLMGETAAGWRENMPGHKNRC